MALKDLLTKIKSKLPADADTELVSLLADASRETDTLFADLSAANAESKGRKEEIKTLKGKVEELETNLQSSKPDPELEKKASAYDALLKKQSDEVIAKWNKVAKTFEVDKAHKSFDKIEKVKDRFVKLDGKDLTPEEAAKNLDTYELLQSTGYFEIEKAPDTPPDKSRRPEGAKPAEPVFK